MAGNFTESSTTWPTPLPPITIIPTLDALGRAQVLDILFEPSTPLHALVLPLLEERPFQSYPELIAAVGQQLRSLQKSSVPGDKTRLRKILEAHPRLGEKRVEDLSESSRTEEEAMHIASDLAAAGDSDETADRERMLAMNDEYEAAFAGLRYVVFINSQSRDVIMKDMTRRIQRGDVEEEYSEAIQAMCDIAVDRAQKMGAQMS